MIVVLRNGKVLKYNKATNLSIENGVFILRPTSRWESNNFCADIPIDMVERIEAEKPCSISKEKSIKQIKKIY